MITKPLKGYRVVIPRGYYLTKEGKVAKIRGFGLSASGKIKQLKSKKVRVTKRKTP